MDILKKQTYNLCNPLWGFSTRKDSCTSGKEHIYKDDDVDDFELSVEDVERIEKMDLGKSLILDIQSTDEVHRLHGIRFEQ